MLSKRKAFPNYSSSTSHTKKIIYKGIIYRGIIYKGIIIIYRGIILIIITIVKRTNKCT